MRNLYWDIMAIIYYVVGTNEVVSFQIDLG
jgi:hypothetical protein